MIDENTAKFSWKGAQEKKIGCIIVTRHCLKINDYYKFMMTNKLNLNYENY